MILPSLGTTATLTTWAEGLADAAPEFGIDMFAAQEALRPCKADPEAMAELRRLLVELGEGAAIAQLEADLVIAKAAALLVAGAVVLVVVAAAWIASPVPEQPKPPRPEPPRPVPPKPKPPPPKVGNLIVTVFDDEEKVVVKNVPVAIHGPQPSGMPSNAAGKAAFMGITVGGYSIDHSDTCLKPASASATVLADQTTNARLNVRHSHAAVAIHQLDFADKNRVERDTKGLFPPHEWVEGRAADQQAPVRFTRNTAMAFKATFKVVATPCRHETVEVKGNATFGTAKVEWKGTVNVSPSDKPGKLLPVLALSGTPALPDAVGLFESSDITWQMKPIASPFAAAGTTHNVVYVTLGDPDNTPAYWTLLDVSCRASSKSVVDDEDKLAAAMFVPFTGRAIKRKRDGHALTYWNPDTTEATNTHELLEAPDGSGQCGSWAETLRDMFRVHGVTTAVKVEIYRTRAQARAGTLGFLVKKWTFIEPPTSSPREFTHNFQSQLISDPIPGQSSTHPPPAFFNHFIVHFKGKFYDPSYGAGPFTTQDLWEAAGVAGLFTNDPEKDPKKRQPSRAGFDTSKGAARLLEFVNLATGTKFP